VPTIYQKLHPPLSPLRELQKKNTSYRWTSKQEKAFQDLKTAIFSAPVLARPDFQKPFILHTDASRIGVGAILAQKDDQGLEHPIYFASKALSPAQSNWSATELEGYAVVWAVDKFHQYLAGSPFKVYTDHSALQWLFSKSPMKENKPRVTRWIESLQGYDFTIHYKRGRDNLHVDALSRLGY